MEAELQFLPQAVVNTEALDLVRRTLEAARAPNQRTEVDLCVDCLDDLRRLTSLPAVRSSWELEQPLEEFLELVDVGTLVVWALRYPDPWEAWW